MSSLTCLLFPLCTVVCQSEELHQTVSVASDCSFFTYQFEDNEKDQPLSEGGPDKEGEERYLFVEVAPDNEGKDEIVLTISHLNLEEQQDQPAPNQTSAPKAAATKPPRKAKGRLARVHGTLRDPLVFLWEGGSC